jgi:hypothetical protein
MLVIVILVSVDRLTGQDSGLAPVSRFQRRRRGHWRVCHRCLGRDQDRMHFRWRLGECSSRRLYNRFKNTALLAIPSLITNNCESIHTP